jgi:hypothetical protein
MSYSKADYMKEKGFNEGLLDNLFESEFTTVEERARFAASKMGYKTHIKSFVIGYVAGKNAFDAAGHAQVENPFRVTAKLYQEL